MEIQETCRRQIIKNGCLVVGLSAAYSVYCQECRKQNTILTVSTFGCIPIFKGLKPLKMDPTEGSETSANINQTLGIHPKVETVITCVAYKAPTIP
jgi:hypothetical protein